MLGELSATNLLPWMMSSIANCYVMLHPVCHHHIVSFGAQNGTGADFSPNSFGSPLLIVLPSEVCDSPDKAAHYHILGLFRGIISDLALGWLQS
jgi:hypothetical protein